MSGNPVDTYTAQYTGDNIGKNIPLAGNAYKAFSDGFKAASDASKGNVPAAAGDVANVAADTTNFAADAVTAATDPLNFLITKGLGFLENVFSPLKELLQLVTGDPTTLASCAQKFDGVANSLNQLAGNVQQTALAGGQNWFGAAADASGQQIGATKQSIEDTAAAAGHIATLLQISSMLMQAAYDIVNGIIATVVEQVVITWIAAQAAAVFTLGGSEAAAAVATTGEVAEGAAQAGGKVEETSGILSKIIAVLKKIWNMIKELGGKLNSKLEDVAPKVGAQLKNVSGKIGEGLEKAGSKVGGKFGDELESAGKNFKDPMKAFNREADDKAASVVDRAEGAGHKALDGVDTEGKSATEIFKEGLGKNLGEQVTKKVKNTALGEFGIPGSDPKTTLDTAKAWTNVVSKSWQQGTGLGKAIDYSADPGGYTAATTPSSSSSPQQQPTEPEPAPVEPPSGGGVEPIPNWPSGEPDGGTAEPV